MNRRAFVSSLTSMCGLGAVSATLAANGVKASVKEISPPADTIYVVEMDPQLAREGVTFDEDAIRNALKSAGIPPERVIVLSGCTIKALPNGMVYHREKVGNVECEYLAKTEADLQDRLAQWEK